MEFHAAPLPHEWMIASIIGFFVSLLLIYPGGNGGPGASLVLFFIMCVLAGIFLFIGIAKIFLAKFHKYKSFSQQWSSTYNIFCVLMLLTIFAISNIIQVLTSWCFVFLQLNPGMSQKWGTAFMLVFILMFLASVVSMSKATTDPDHIDALANRK